MTTQQTAQAIEVPVEAAAVPLDDEQLQRASAYALVAALLRSAPTPPVLEQVGTLAADSSGGDELALATSMLGLAARSCQPDRLEQEYHDLFIGIGRGELMPYGSWYMTGFLMERPLSQLRDDLVQLGFERDPQVVEPEDHIAALCEVLSLLIQEQRPFKQQAQFYQNHLAPWCERFFADLSEAESASFYRNLGRFGTAFMQLERRYFEMQV